MKQPESLQSLFLLAAILCVPSAIASIHHQLILDNSKDTTLNCQPNGTWSLSDGTPVTNITQLRHVFKNGTLHFPGFDWSRRDLAVHAAAYTCRPGAGLSHFTVQAGPGRSKRQAGGGGGGAGGAQLLERFPARAVAAGAGAGLRCTARGAARLVWARDGLALPPAHSSSSMVGGVLRSDLNISRAVPEDAGLYSCTALADGNSSSATHRARLDVYGTPYIRSLGPIKILSGSSATIYCPYYGYPINKVQWERSNHTPIHFERYKRSVTDASTKLSNLRLEPASLKSERARPDWNFKKRHRRGFTSDDEGLLIIDNVDSSDNNAIFTCTVTSPTGEMARRSFEVQVLEPPLLDELSFGSNIQEGQIAKVVCSVKSGDTPVFFSWLKDGMPITSNLKIEEKNLDLFSVLVIRKVGLQHCGTYTCIAANHAAKVNTSTELFIKVAPKWIEEPQNSSVVMGRLGQVGCSASGYPQPQVHWMKREESAGLWRPVLELRGSGVLSLPNGSLVIEQVSSGDEGLYSCRVENGVGQPLNKNVWISVKKPVSFEVAVTNITTKVGHPTTVTCEAFGDHPIRISWTHNGRSLEFLSSRMKVTSHQTSQGAVSEVLLSSSDPEDAGHYQCRAANPHGTALHSANLFVQEPPGLPVEAAVEAVKGRSVRLGWQAPSGAPPIAYRLQYTPHHHLASPHWDSAATLNVSSIHGQLRQRADINGLRSATPYAARLCSVGEADVSPYTRPLLFTTLEEVPSSPPINVHVETSARPGELHVSWLPPPLHTVNGLLLGYLIRAVPQINQQTEENVKTVKISSQEASLGSTGGTLQVAVGGLLKSARYSVTVSCYNSMGSGPPSSPLYRDTKEGVPEVAPEGVECSAISSTSIQVSWRPLPPHLQGGAMLGYTLIYSTIDGIQLNDTTAHSSIYLQRLQKYSNYSVSVGAYCGLGLGPLSLPVVCATMEDLPGAPADIKALVMTSNSIVISWQPPLNPNGHITYYTVSLKPVSGSSTVQTYSVNTITMGDEAKNSIGGMSHAVRGVAPGRRYEVWVSASNKAGEGKPSRRAIVEPNDTVVAGIASIGGRLWVGSGTSPRLACRALGSPQPRTVWYHDHRVITHHPSFTLNKDDSLLIHNIDHSLEGNYTCLAKNLFGSDLVSYLVWVVSPPAPPSLRASPAPRALLLEWGPPPPVPRQAHNRTTVILGYTISWRESNGGGNWETEEITGGGTGSRRLGGLRCGTQYEARIVAHSTTGTSTYATIRTRTLGSVMTAPVGNEWIWRNSSHMSLELDNWLDGECGPARWGVDYRALPSRLWLQPDTLPIEEGRRLIMAGMNEAQWYQLRVTATNQAGVTTAIYSVATTTIYGEEIGPPSESLDTSVLVMVCSCVLLLLCMLVCIFAAVQKHRHRIMCGSVAGSVYKERSCSQGPPLPTPACPPLPARLYTSPLPQRKPSSANSEMFEISPYAQFSMGFQTFGHVENQDRPAYIKGKQGIFSTETSFQMGSESEDSDSISKSTPMPNAPNKMCRVQYHR